MEQRYIPGDLIMTNGMSGGTAKDVIYRIASSDPSRIFVLDDGTVLKGIVRLWNLEGAKLEDKGYLYYGSCHVYFKDIVPITPEILDNNKWKSLRDIHGGGQDLMVCITSLNQIKIILLYGNFVVVKLSIALKRLDMSISFNIFYLV